eukprot:15481059-Alexandrium_andersonii.AAC.1
MFWAVELDSFIQMSRLKFCLASLTALILTLHLSFKRPIVIGACAYADNSSEAPSARSAWAPLHLHGGCRA